MFLAMAVMCGWQVQMDVKSAFNMKAMLHVDISSKVCRLVKSLLYDHNPHLKEQGLVVGEIVT